MQPPAFDRIDSGHRGGNIAGQAEIAAMNVQRMSEPQGLNSVRQRSQDLPRRYAKMQVLVIDIQMPLIELERVNIFN